jgi:hypothetical protein
VVVLTVPLCLTAPSVEVDKITERLLTNNSERMRKRRLDFGLSPEIQVPSKFRLVPKLAIPRLFSKQ